MVSQLSIIIINYNTFDITCNCINSIYRHTQNIAFEIILVDNASQECDPSVFLEKFPHINLIVSNVNLGFAGGNNLGIAHSKGDIILLLNSDTELIEDSLSLCYKYILAAKGQLALTCKLTYRDGSIQKQCNRFPSIFLNLVELFRLHKLLSKHRQGQLFLSSYFDHETKIEPDWIWGTFFMFNRSVLEKLSFKKLDDTFFMYCEDMKWCYDFKKINVKVTYLPDTRIIHYLGASSNTESRVNHIVKNEFLFVRLTRGLIYQWIYTIIRSLNIFSTFNKQSTQIAIQMIKNI